MNDNLKLPIWIPSKERVLNSNLTKFTNYISEKINYSFDDYYELYNWSIKNSPLFWEYFAEFSKIKFSKKHTEVLKGNEIRKAQWFVDSKLNISENLLKNKSDKIALISWQENKNPIKISYKELNKQVAKFAESLKNIGVKKSDRVAAYISNIPEAIIAMLATTSIGAVWSSCSPDFGFSGVLDRFGQIKPKVLIAVNGYSYNGKVFDSTNIIKELIKEIPNIEKVITIKNIENLETEFSEKTIEWNNFISKDDCELIYEQLPFDHPLYIMYSSGTTGKPKCIVHGAGGTLIQHLKELILHTNLKEEDTITYFTTCGWMMWNWLVSSLYIGSTIFLYDGSPSFPNLEILFSAIEKERINIFGTSPKFLSACEFNKIIPKDKFDLSSLCTVLSTGSPLSDTNFEYVYNSIKNDVQLSSISGGTDIISCFMLGNPNLPVYKGEIQCRGLALKVETYNDKYESIINEVGELVCTAPFPSRPIYFWNDENGEKYKNAYFEIDERIWKHGDYVKINDNGGCIVYGRSDATLNPGGVRIGTAEIYEPVEAMEEIDDSIVIGKNIGTDTEIILFVVLRTNQVLDNDLRKKIKSKIRSERTPRHVPNKIFQVNEIPRTISGKKVEMTVTKIIEGKEINNFDALKNPESLTDYYKISKTF